ncbi:MAG TPA: cell division protein FtsA [Alphaproteobacteria bacterium]|nr:cell division protein FtsA [Alphaproteobacteria bacterium]
MKSRLKGLRNGLVAALDIGTSKIACFIARIEASGTIRVIGIGHHASDGVRSGMITDVEAAENAVLATVHAAEQMAGETIDEVVVNLSGGAPSSDVLHYDVSIAGHEVGDGDVRKVLAQGHAACASSDRELIHCVPVGYSIDGAKGIRDPRGMYGDRLGVNMHMVTATTGAVRTLVTCLARCRLEVADIVISPYAAGLSALVEDEINLGATVIDMGAGTTSVAVFYDGHLIHADNVPIGGAHVTADIARGLSTPLAHAERMKTLYGNAMASGSDNRDMIEVPLMGEEDRHQGNTVPRSMLVGIIRPRLEETFELIRGRLEMTGYDKIAGRRMVLTGGASQLQGVAELAADVLDKQVRRGRPLKIAGLADSTHGPAFAACAGLLTYAQRRPDEAPAAALAARARTLTQEPNGLIGRFGLWLRENL